MIKKIFSQHIFEPFLARIRPRLFTVYVLYTPFGCLYQCLKAYQNSNKSHEPISHKISKCRIWTPLKAENWLLLTIFQAKKVFSGAETHMRVIHLLLFNFLTSFRSFGSISLCQSTKKYENSKNWPFLPPFLPISWEPLGRFS